MVVTAQVSFEHKPVGFELRLTSIEKANVGECLRGEALGCSSTERWWTELYVPGSFNRNALPDLGGHTLERLG